VICTTLNAIREHRPCADGWAKLLAYLGKTGSDDEPLPLVVILDSNGLDDALWALRAVTGEDARIRRYAVWCARQVQYLITDTRLLDLLDVVERHADGLATDDDLVKASTTAKASIWAQLAVRSATESTSWNAARNTAHDAAKAVAWEAGETTAGGVVSASGEVAWIVMRERQAEKFREVFGEQEVGNE